MLHLSAAVDQLTGYDPSSCAELTRLAEQGALDFVTLDDPVTGTGTGPDAFAALSRVAPETSRIGLIGPAVTTGPGHVPAAVADLDRVSRGRAGWRLDVAAEGEDRPADGTDEPPLVDRGHPVRVVDAAGRRARRTAARCADVVLVHAVGAARTAVVREELRASAAGFGRDPQALRVFANLVVDLGGGEHAAEPGHGGGGPRQTARGPLYRGGPVDLAELIASWHTAGAVDGFHLTPAEPHRDLERLVNGTVALLQHRGLFRTFYPGSTLREHLGLARLAAHG
jgi:alkanesulfonate monooxygenase SsuD/methylene tetrahydromethanopterin reductase-like flavin-dependent oxidoreductase (luciferase family)